MSNVSIIGAGTWGVALAKVLHDNGNNVMIWSAIGGEIDELYETKTQMNLPGFVLADDILLTKDLKTAVDFGDVLVLSVASPYTRRTAARMREFVEDGQVIVSVAKGIEENTMKTLSEQVEEELPQARVCVLSGPSHAEEVSVGKPTTVVVGSHSCSLAHRVAELFNNTFFRVYVSPDMKGIELGAALKNVIALAAGMADGMGFGDNAKAAIITRGIVELSRLGIAMGGYEKTFNGLTGTGDLIVTCASMHSRNRRAGILIGQGKTYEEAMAEVKMVVEGVYSAKAALQLAKKYNVEMPIVEGVNEVLFQGAKPMEVFTRLMNREMRNEIGVSEWENE
ncbi:MAG: NAD(P)-dependent glycerol-3-phosphate dehydrogenase [Lachnospiraceae bacterium]|nr:NAD(P)-dependent glycerol-3-phosphate dehydrogenase [Lachnospiraceae bacterium]